VVLDGENVVFFPVSEPDIASQGEGLYLGEGSSVSFDNAKIGNLMGATEHPKKRKPRIRPVPAVSRAIAILRLLGDSKHPLGLKDISDKLGLVTSTCLHILRVLVDEHFVAVDLASKKYSLDFGLVELSSRMLRENTSLRALQDDLTLLAAQFKVTVTTVRIFGIKRSTVLAVAYPDRVVNLNVQLGSRFPSLLSATGRCYAAFSEFDEETLRHEFEKLSWHNPPSYEAWIEEIEETRVRGFGLDRANYLAGMLVIAVPYKDHANVMTHSVSIIGMENELRGKIDELAARIQQIISKFGGG